MTPEHRLDALKEAVAQSKTDMALFGGPLPLLLAQLRFLVGVSDFWVKFLATIGIFSFFVGLAIAYLLWTYKSAWYAIELLKKDGPVEVGFGSKYLKAVGPNGDEFTEDGYIFARSYGHRAMLCLLCLGYISLAILVLTLFWNGG